MLKLGNQGVAAMYLGGRKITKAYLGEALVFGASAPPEPVRYTVTSVYPAGSLDVFSSSNTAVSVLSPVTVKV